MIFDFLTIFLYKLCGSASLRAIISRKAVEPQSKKKSNLLELKFPKIKRAPFQQMELFLG